MITDWYGSVSGANRHKTRAVIRNILAGTVKKGGGG